MYGPSEMGAAGQHLKAPVLFFLARINSDAPGLYTARCSMSPSGLPGTLLHALISKMPYNHTALLLPQHTRDRQELAVFSKTRLAFCLLPITPESQASLVLGCHLRDGGIRTSRPAMAHFG